MASEPKPKPRRAPNTPYTEEEKAIALETVNACGGNVAEAARLTGIEESTVRWWTKGQGVAPETFADFAAKKQGAVAGKLRALLDRLADSLADEDAIAAATLQQRATTFGIVYDKIRLGDGAPTQITRTEDTAALAALRQKAEELIAALLPDCGGDRDAAIARAREMAPTLSNWIN